MKKLISILFIYILSLGLGMNIAFAQTPTSNCQPIYGGGENCQPGVLSVNTAVLNPKTNQLVHNLGSNDPMYNPNDILTFQIKVVNTSQSTISNITLTDTFPQYTVYNAGPGTYDTRSRTVTYQIASLIPSQTATLTYLGRVLSNDQITNSASPCLNNVVKATTSDGQIFQDSSQFCVKKQNSVLGGSTNIKSSPVTGPNPWLLLSFIPMFTIGIFIHNKVSINN